MDKLLPKLAISVMAASLLYSVPVATQESPTTKKAARIRITQGPELESANDNSAIISWKSNNPRGFARALRHRALWYTSYEPERDGEISNQDKPGPYLYRFPRAHGRSQAWYNILLHGRLDGSQWQARWGEEHCQALHYTLREKFGWRI